MAPRYENLRARFRAGNPAMVADTMARADSQFMHTRGWEVAKTNRLNQAEWVESDGLHINRLLETQLPELWRRCHSEFLNNPMMAGVIETYKVDFVGDSGPKLQVLSDSPKYNEALEEIWEETWEQIDWTGNYTGPDMMKSWIHQWWLRGDHFLLDANDARATTTIKYRVVMLDPPRIRTRWEHLGDMNVLAGIKRTPKGVVQSYDVAEPLPTRLESFNSQATEGGSTFRFDTFSADEMLHHFRKDEPEQIRGYPWATPVLGISRDIRDYDEKVLDAMRLAASQSIVWHTNNPEVEPWDGAEGMVVDLERNSSTTGPPGWEPTVMDTKQPGPEYVEYRNERHRELGRPVAMPSLVIRAGAEDHNMSSSRFDGAKWGSVISSNQRGLERTTMNPLARKVQGEATLVTGRRGRFLLPRKPRIVKFSWQWDSQPSVDPMKEAKADEINYKNGFTTLTQMAKKNNLTLEELLITRERENQMLRDRGLIVITDAQSQQDENGIPDGENENENEEAQTQNA